MTETRKQHWETIYATKKPGEVSWTQAMPQTSLDLIHALQLPKTAAIIDVGGGDSHLVDVLLQEGYTNITVLDISEKAIERAKQRLGAKAQLVHWVVSDVTEFEPPCHYEVWHDRATFHFLTTSVEIAKYMAACHKAEAKYLIIGTFSDNGPDQCSGLHVQQYNEASLQQAFHQDYIKMHCIRQDHITPMGAKQNFLFCMCRKKLQGERPGKITQPQTD